MTNHIECSRCPVQLPHLRALLRHRAAVHGAAIAIAVELVGAQPVIAAPTTIPTGLRGYNNPARTVVLTTSGRAIIEGRETRMTDGDARMAATREPWGEEDEASIVGRLMGTYLIRAEIRRLSTEERDAAKRIRDWMEKHGRQQIEDGEHHLYAQLAGGAPTVSYDVAKMPEELLGRLAQQGVLKIDTAVARALAGKTLESGQLLRYRVPGPPTAVQLRIEREEER